METGTLSFIDRETCTCELYSKVKIDDVELLCELPVRKRIRSELRNLVTHFHHYVVLRALSFRNLVTRYIWKKYKKRFELRVVLLGFSVEFRRLCLEGSDLSLYSLSFFLPAFFHQTADESGFLFLLSKA